MIWHMDYKIRGGLIKEQMAVASFEQITALLQKCGDLLKQSWIWDIISTEVYADDDDYFRFKAFR